MAIRNRARQGVACLQALAEWTGVPSFEVHAPLAIGGDGDMVMANAKERVSAHRSRLCGVGLLAGLLVMAGCGTGYREGAAGSEDAGSAAHGEAIVAIAREMSERECAVFGATDSCKDLRRELTQELARCSTATGCDQALAASVDGEAEQVAAYLAVSGLEASMKALGDRFRGGQWPR